MAHIVCLDTNVVIWGLMNEGRPEDDIKREQARHLLAVLENQRDLVVIPSLVLSEVTVKMEPRNRELMLSMVFEQGRVLTYCGRCALEYKKVRDAVRPGRTSVLRRELAVDSMIIACCIKHNVDTLYTDDPAMRNLARNFLDCRPLPDLPPPQPYQYPLLP